VDAEAIRVTLSEYLARLNAQDWDWVIPRQHRVGNLVGVLVDSVMWPVMSGGYWPSDYPTVQRQWVETALVNLDADPTLADQLSPEGQRPNRTRGRSRC
jgi:hypothetical protein